MKKFISSISISVIAFILFTVGMAQAEDPVYFADSNLKSAIEAALGINDPNPTDMLGLTELSAPDLNISDITGIEYATNLNALWLHYNQISDISPLSGLTNINQLYLKYNLISDISPLASLTNLIDLNISDNPINDISSLANLTNLTSLNLSDTQSGNISPLEGLTNLNSLILDWNQISDISPLAGLTNLTYLDLSWNAINDVSSLANLTNLTSLDLSMNIIENISPLSGLTNLTSLALRSNRIEDIKPLMNLTEFNYLWLDANKINDISSLRGLRNLTVLYLSNNPLNQLAYCIYIPIIEDKNPDLTQFSYDPGECTMDTGYFTTRLEGTWYGRGLFTQDNSGADNFGYDIATYNFQANGTFSGVVNEFYGDTWNDSGLTMLNQDGTVSGISFSDQAAFHPGVNSRRDVMTLNRREDNELGLDIMVKQGSSYADADLTGAWYIGQLKTQQNGYPDNFAAEWGTMTILGDGSFTCDWNDFDGQTWTDTGTVSIEPNGITTFIFDLGDSAVAAMNAGKDVMISNAQETDNIVLDVLVKKGSFYSQEDITGTWFYRNLEVPLNGQGTNDNFGYQSSTVTIQNDGSYMSVETYNTTIENNGQLSWDSGTVTVDADGKITSAGDDSVRLFLGAGKDVILGVYKDPNDEFGLEIIVKKDPLKGDLNLDGKVDLVDFAIFADNWLEGATP